MRAPHASRRAVLATGLAAGALAGLGRRAGAAAPLPETPSCAAPADATAAQTAGPFFTPDTPEKADFTADGPGEPLALAGFVLDTACRPQAGALVELWHADAAGAYDNAGYRFRGHQRTDADGRFAFLTVVPGHYTGRTRHYHVKVQAAGGPLLTTQLYFPDEPANARDRIFDPRLLMTLGTADGQITGRYDFVVATG